MNNKELFDHFYNDIYINILDEYYKEIEKDLRLINIKNIITPILIIIIPIFLTWYRLNNVIPTLFLILLSLIYGILVTIAYIKVNKNNKPNIYNKIKYKILDDIFTIISEDENTKILPNNRVSIDSFKKGRLFNLEELSYTGENFIQFNINKQDITIADMEIYKSVEKYKETYFYIGNRKYLRHYKTYKKKNVFKGLYIGTRYSKNKKNLIQIIPKDLKNTINKNINKYYDLCDNELKLENLDFSKKYLVYSNDEIKARMTLTLTMLETINELEQFNKNNKYFIFKEDGRLSIYLEDITIDELLTKCVNIDRRKEKENLYNLYNEFIKIVQMTIIINNAK